MVDVPAYTLLPGDILGGQPIAEVRVLAPMSRQHAEVVVEMYDGRVLRLPNACERIRLHARPAYTDFFSMS